MHDINGKTYYICIDQWWLKTASPKDRWDWVKKNLRKVYGEPFRMFIDSADLAWKYKGGNLYVLIIPMMVGLHFAICKTMGNGEVYSGPLISHPFHIIGKYIKGEISFGVDLKIPICDYGDVNGVVAVHPHSFLSWIPTTIDDLEMPKNWTGDYLVASGEKT